MEERNLSMQRTIYQKLHIGWSMLLFEPNIKSVRKYLINNCYFGESAIIVLAILSKIRERSIMDTKLV